MLISVLNGLSINGQAFKALSLDVYDRRNSVAVLNLSSVLIANISLQLVLVRIVRTQFYSDGFAANFNWETVWAFTSPEKASFFDSDIASLCIRQLNGIRLASFQRLTNL